VLAKADVLLYTSSQGEYRRGAAERVYQVYLWAHEAVRLRMAAGGLDMPPPILAQIYGALQKGIEAFEHCRWVEGVVGLADAAGLGKGTAMERLSQGDPPPPRPPMHHHTDTQLSPAHRALPCRILCDTPFPFTWSQLLTVMLLCLQFTVPFMCVTSCECCFLWEGGGEGWGGEVGGNCGMHVSLSHRASAMAYATQRFSSTCSSAL
jgi:hypothetical protein